MIRNNYYTTIDQDLHELEHSMTMLELDTALDMLEQEMDLAGIDRW